MVDGKINILRFHSIVSDSGLHSVFNEMLLGKCLAIGKVQVQEDVEYELSWLRLFLLIMECSFLEKEHCKQVREIEQYTMISAITCHKLL